MERFCKDLKKHASKIINYEEKEMIPPLTDEENKPYKKQKVCYICKKEFNTDKNDQNDETIPQSKRSLSLYRNI